MSTDRPIDYVKYASYIFISQYRSTCGSNPSGVMYNKFMILLNRELRDKLGKDIRLPHCWYRWGDEVVRYNMPYLEWNHDDPHKTIVQFYGQIHNPSSRDEVLNHTRLFAKEFISRYTGTEGVDLAIDEVYSKAPFRFQNDFRTLRDNLKLAQKNITVSNHLDMVRDLYQTAMTNYPLRSFPSTELEVTQFDRLFTKALDEGLSVDRLQQMSETFWFYFCYHLRLHKNCHANVLKSTLDIWESILPEALDIYEEKIQNYAYYLFPDGSDDPIINRLLMDRKKRFEDMNALLAEMDC